MVKTCVLYTSHKIDLLLKLIEIDGIFVNRLHKYSKSDCHKFQKFKKFKKLNFTSDVSVHAIVTCQGGFVPVPPFADFFSSLVQNIVPSIYTDLQLFN